MTDQEFREGYKAFCSGHKKIANPYTDTDKAKEKEMWDQGFDAAARAFWS
jgi:hypothetical protein